MFTSLLGVALTNLIYFALQVTNSGTFPRPLTEDEERIYLEAYKNGDLSAREKLIEHNLRLVAHIIKKYYSSANEQDDLISIGTIGLIKAVSTYDYSKGTRLATYAARCIENEILMHFRNLRKSAQDVYISDPIDSDGDGNSLTLMDVIYDDDAIIDNLDYKINRQKLYRFIYSELESRERAIIEMRYGLRGFSPLTQREVAAKLKISRSYVSRIEKKALLLLRKRFEREK